MSSQASPYKDH